MVRRSTIANIWTGMVAAFGLVMLVSYQNCGVQMIDANSNGSSNSVEMIAKVDLTNSGDQSTSVSSESFNARVISTGLGGSCEYIVIDSNGQRFELAGIDRTLLVEDRLLYVRGFFRPDLVSVCQTGRIIQIEKVEVLATSPQTTNIINIDTSTQSESNTGDTYILNQDSIPR